MTTSLPSRRKNFANVVIPALSSAKRITIALLLTIATVSFVQAQEPTLTSDEADYPPGSTVILTGSDFGANEVVTLQVAHVGDDPDGTDPQYHESWEVTTDSDGNFETTWIVPIDGDALGALFKATAEGKTSLLYAETTFTDNVDANDGDVMVESSTDVCSGTSGNVVKSKK